MFVIYVETNLRHIIAETNDTHYLGHCVEIIPTSYVSMGKLYPLSKSLCGNSYRHPGGGGRYQTISMTMIVCYQKLPQQVYTVKYRNQVLLYNRAYH